MSQTLLQVKIVTPDKKVFQSEAIMVHSETKLGKIEFLVNHAPAILSTVPCETIVKDEDGTEIRFFTSKGIISIKDNILSFCCDSAEAIEDIDTSVPFMHDYTSNRYGHAIPILSLLIKQDRDD